MEQHNLHRPDVHKDTIAVALRSVSEVRSAAWQVVNTPTALDAGGKAGAMEPACDFAMRLDLAVMAFSAGVKRTQCVVVARFVDSAQAWRSGQNRPTGCDQQPNCTGRVNCHRYGFQTRPMRRSAICARDWRRCA
jgi:hypothetical protein